jgi:hypothetical protein
MTTVSISPQGQITLPDDVLNIWKNNTELTLLFLGDRVVLRPTHYEKSDEINDLGGFFKNSAIRLTTEELCQPVDLHEA